MNATELMIGDWVYDTFYKRKMRIFQIDSESFAWCDGKGVPCVELEPIPLASEILEQNGFELQRDKSELGTLDTYWLGSELGAFRIHRLNNGDYQFGLAKIKFVHQLQHALRLCGIDKEIKV